MHRSHSVRPMRRNDPKQLSQFSYPLLLTLFLALAANAQHNPRPSIEADGWVLTAEVECGNAERIEHTGDSRFVVAPQSDPVPIEVQKTGPISNYAIYLDITNTTSEARTIEIDVAIPAWLIRDGFDYFLRKPYVIRSPGDLNWVQLPPDRQSDTEDQVHLRIDFGPNERKILSTVAVYPYSDAAAKLSELAARSAGKARIVEIGKSVEGRPILSLEAGRRGKPRVIFASSLQPGEPGAWAILAMAESAVSGTSAPIDELDIAFIPITNPDGVVRGLCNVNARGEIALVGFKDAAEGRAAPQEAKLLWDYLRKQPPVAYVDFHFLRLPNHHKPAVYNFDPDLYSDPARRELAVTLRERLRALSGAPLGSKIGREHPLWPGLVTFNAIVRWNTAASLYQNTGPETSHHQAQTRGVEVMETVLNTLREYLPAQPR